MSFFKGTVPVGTYLPVKRDVKFEGSGFCFDGDGVMK